jgi:hypothetical protein
MRGSADAIASAATRSLLTGTDFGDNLIAVLPSVIGRTIGTAIAGAVAGRDDHAVNYSGMKKDLLAEAAARKGRGSVLDDLQRIATLNGLGTVLVASAADSKSNVTTKSMLMLASTTQAEQDRIDIAFRDDAPNKIAEHLIGLREHSDLPRWLAEDYMALTKGKAEVMYAHLTGSVDSADLLAPLASLFRNAADRLVHIPEIDQVATWLEEDVEWMQHEEGTSDLIGTIDTIADVTVPGHQSLGEAVTSYQRGSYLEAGAYAVAGLAEIGLAIWSVGASHAALTAVRGARAATASRSARGGTSAADDVARTFLPHLARGRASERRVLQQLGLPKNTFAVSSAEGRAIPDALTDTMSLEIKDTVRVDATRQLRIQAASARAHGRRNVLVTGPHTHITDRARALFDQIIELPDLGPQR